MKGYFQREKGARAGALGLAVGGFFIAACSTSPAKPPPAPVDCTVQDPWDIHVVEDYELNPLPGNQATNEASWFSFGDYTPGARHTGQVSAATGRLPTVPIEGNGRCNSHRALVLATEGHNDYGSGFGAYCLGGNYVALSGPLNTLYPCTPQDATGYDGFAFWARDPALPMDHMPGEVIKRVLLDHILPDGEVPEGGLPEGGTLTSSSYYDATLLATGTDQGPFNPTVTNKSVSIFFDDSHSTDSAFNFNNNAVDAGAYDRIIPNPCTQPAPSMGQCITTVDPNTGNTTTGGSGCVPLPNQCGNSYTRTLILTDGWQLYLLPFDSFKQDALPNRTDQPIDTANIFTFGMRFPKEAVAEVWISNLGFYRKKQ
jgi:hypothetical protein